MDVSHDGRLPPQELDIGDPCVVFQDGFANFLEVETAALRDRFVPQNHFNRDAYEDLFDASKDLVRSTFEQIWSKKFDWEDVKKDILRVDKIKLETALKLEVLKPDLDNLSFFRKTLGSEKPERELRGILKLLKELENDLYQVKKVKRKKHSLFNIVTYKNSRKLEQLEKSIQEEEHSIAGDLQLLLVRRQREAIQAEAIQFEAFHKFFEEKVEAIKKFIKEWRAWRDKVHWEIFKAQTVAVCAEILLLIAEIIFFRLHPPASLRNEPELPRS